MFIIYYCLLLTEIPKMPIGPFGEIIGTTGTLECLGEAAAGYKSKVIAPRNPKLLKGENPELKVTVFVQYLLVN